MTTLLLVEDNEMNRDMLSRRLLRRGYQVLIAEDGLSGLRMASEMAPDVILMDISLPDVDGLEVTRRLKADPRTQRIPIIVLTAHAMFGDRQQALAAGGDDYDIKPIEFERLLGKIQALVERGSPVIREEKKRQAISHFRHELRTSLTAIIGYSEDLLETTPEKAAPESVRGLKEVKALGDAMLGVIHERLSGEGLAALADEALPARIAEVSAACLVQVREVDPLCVSLLRLAEKDGLYLQIPILCRIQAAGVMLHNLLKGYSLEDPARLAEAGVSVLHDGPLPAGKGETVGLPHRGGRVLVVDDNSINRDLLRQWLTRQGHSVDEAGGGEEALARIRKEDYDLILLDLVMPDRSGLSVLDALSQEGRLGAAPIIMLSASDELDGVAQSIERGADDYVVKPFHMALLKARIRLALELRLHRQRERAYLAVLKEHRDKA